MYLIGTKERIDFSKQTWHGASSEKEKSPGSMASARLVYGVRLCIHARLPGVAGHVWHGHNEQADSAEEKEDES